MSGAQQNNLFLYFENFLTVGTAFCGAPFLITVESFLSMSDVP